MRATIKRSAAERLADASAAYDKIKAKEEAEREKSETLAEIKSAYTENQQYRANRDIVRSKSLNISPTQTHSVEQEAYIELLKPSETKTDFKTTTPFIDNASSLRAALAQRNALSSVKLAQNRSQTAEKSSSLTAYEEQPTYNEKQKKLSFQYSSILQQQKQQPVTDEDRKFFKLNTTPTRLNSFIGMTATDDDIRVAKYYYEKATAKDSTKEDKDQWRDIRNYIMNKDAQRYGTAVADTVAKNSAGEPTFLAKANAALNTGMAEGLAAPVKAIGTYLGNDRIIDNAFAVSKYMDMGNQGKVEQLALSAVESIGRMVPSQLIGMATNPAVGSVIMGLGSAESAYEESLKDGATPGKARVYGALVGAAEGTMEYFLGGIPGLKKGSGKALDALGEGLEGVGKKLLNKAAPKALKGLDNAIAKIIKNPMLRSSLEEYIKNIGSEALEETLQDIFENALQKWYLGKKDVDLLDEETLESGFLGGVVAALLGVPNLSINVAASTKYSGKNDTALPETEAASAPSTTDVKTAETSPVTADDLRAALADVKAYESKDAAVRAVKQLYDTGEINTKQISTIRKSKAAREAFDATFGTDIYNVSVPSELVQTVRQTQFKRQQELSSNAAAKAVADFDTGKIDEDTLVNTPGALDYIEKIYTERQAAINKAREAGDSAKAERLENTAKQNKSFFIGLQFFATPRKLGFTPKENADIPGVPTGGLMPDNASNKQDVLAQQAEPTVAAPSAAAESVSGGIREEARTETNAPRTASEGEAEASKIESGAEYSGRADTGSKYAPNKPVESGSKPRDMKPISQGENAQGAGKVENKKAFSRPEGTSKLAESFHRNGNIDEKSLNAIEELYNDPEKLVYDKKTDQKNVEAAKAMYDSATQNAGINGAVNKIREIAESGKKLTSEDAAFFVYAAKMAAQNGETDAFIEILTQSAILASESGQVVQAFSLVGKLSPDGKKRLVLKKVQQYNKAAKQREQKKNAERKSRDNVKKKSIEKKIVKKQIEKIKEIASDKNIDSLQKETDDALKSLEKRLSEKQNETGTSRENLTEEIDALKKINKQYDTLKSQMSRLDKLQKELGNISEEERLRRTTALLKEIEKMDAYRKLIKKYSSAKTKAIEDVQKRLEFELNKLDGKVTLSEETMEALSSANTSEDIVKASMAAFKEIGQQTPVTVMDLLDWIRYGSMLSGPLSPARNVAANVIQGMAYKAARDSSAVIQSAFLKPERRTAAPLNYAAAADRTLWKYAYNNFDSVRNEILTGSAQLRPDIIINRSKRINNKTANFFLQTFWQKPMETTDIPFLKFTYADTLAQYLKARKITPDTASEEVLRSAQEYAIASAQEATFRRTNDLSSWLSRTSRRLRATAENSEISMTKRVGSGVGYSIIEGLVPFKGTPANIAKQGIVTYSPIGLGKGVVDCVRTKFSGESVTKLCQGLTGTMIAGLGVYLASLGLIHTGPKDDKDKFVSQLGVQSYSIDIGKQNIGLSWIGPLSVPLFVGAAIYESLEDGFEFGDILNICTDVAAPIIDTTMLSGIDNYVESIQIYGWEGAISQPITAYLSQFSPAILSSINKTLIDAKRRTTTTKKASGADANFRYFINRIASRTPGASYALQEYVDCWGRKDDTGNFFRRLFENFVDITSSNKVELSPVDQEILRLYSYEYEGQIITRDQVIPDVGYVKKISAVDSTNQAVEITLTQEQIKQYRTIRGQTAYDTVNALINSNAYKSLTDDQKAEAISMAYEYATAEAKMSIARVNVDSWVLKASGGYGGLPAEVVIACRAVTKSAKSEKETDIKKSLKEAGLQEYSKAYYDSYKNTDTKKYKKYLKEYDLWKYSSYSRE